VRTNDQRDTLVIRDLTSLAAWRRQLYRLVRSKRLPVVELGFPELSLAHNRSFSMLAAGYQKACGCAAGGLFMTIAVAAMIGYFVIHHRHPLDDVAIGHLATLLGGGALAALTGKAVGLLWARLRLLMLVTTMQRAIRRAQQRMIVGSPEGTRSWERCSLFSDASSTSSASSPGSS
jgi:hypothetical protein